jgi:hypothetical protein
MQYLWNKCQQSGHKYIENYRILKKYSKDKIFHNLLGNNNSKVKCLTFGLPIELSCSPILEKNSICSICYARNCRYLYPSVQYGQIRRMYAFFLDKNRFINSCIRQINYSRHNYVRLHDSGDFFSIEYIEAWQQIVKKCRGKKFFSPTRRYLDKQILKQLIKLNAIPNVVIRPSALFIDQEAPIITGLSFGTAVNSKFGTCKATVNHSSCIEENCRKCWNRQCKNIVFKQH